MITWLHDYMITFHFESEIDKSEFSADSKIFLPEGVNIPQGKGYYRRVAHYKWRLH